jgi:UBX domain-containing protein 1/4
VSLLCTDKEEEAKARAAVKAQIEADKRERAAKAAREKALREGKAVPDSSAGPSAPLTSAGGAARTATAGRDYKETRLQIRLASGGQPLTTTLSSDSSIPLYDFVY